MRDKPCVPVYKNSMCHILAYWDGVGKEDSIQPIVLPSSRSCMKGKLCIVYTLTPCIIIIILQTVPSRWLKFQPQDLVMDMSVVTTLDPRMMTTWITASRKSWTSRVENR